MDKSLIEQLTATTSKSLVAMNYELVAAQLFAPAEINNLKYKMLLIFKALLKHKPWKFELHNDLDGSCLAMGEKVCLNLSFIIAARQMLNITEPIDYRVATDLLDAELRQGLSEY